MSFHAILNISMFFVSHCKFHGIEITLFTRELILYFKEVVDILLHVIVCQKFLLWLLKFDLYFKWAQLETWVYINTTLNQCFCPRQHFSIYIDWFWKFKASGKVGHSWKVLDFQIVFEEWIKDVVNSSNDSFQWN